MYQKKQKQQETFIYELNHKFNTSTRRTRLHGDIFDPKSYGGTGGEKKKNQSQIITELEAKLCEGLGLTAYEYLLIKDMLIRECVKEGLLSRDFVTETFKIGTKPLSSSCHMSDLLHLRKRESLCYF